MSARTDEGTGDAIAAWVLYAVQLVFELLLFILLAASVMASDPCGTGVDEPRVCSGAYFATIFYGFAAVLLVAAIAVPMLIVRAGRSERRRWTKPVLGMAVLAILTVVYLVLVSR